MAAGVLNPPGSTYGLCAGECSHTDCAATRAMAAAECWRCDEPIGYSTRFYHTDTLEDGTKVYAHAWCEEEAIDRMNEQRSRRGLSELAVEEVIDP